MDKPAKIVITAALFLALSFGFLGGVWPHAAVSFERLHVFLFNLCTGGTLILYFTEAQAGVQKTPRFFFCLTVLYALGAAARFYALPLVVSVPMVILVERSRQRRFGLVPWDFLKSAVSVSAKFHHASLLCLSIAIVMASLVILNSEYFHLVSYEKLTLDVFFLGYSFPISLITMSIMFSFMAHRHGSSLPGTAPEAQSQLGDGGADGTGISVVEQVCFWTINLGVIIFFVFIIAKMSALEVALAAGLFVSVCVVFYLFLTRSPQLQQKTFLLSGMAFLLCTGITGVLYTLRYYLPFFDRIHTHLLLLHAMTALYGWNLTGLLIIVRWQDFPIRLNSRFLILLHWVIVALLVPMGKGVPALAMAALLGYLVLLTAALFAQGRTQRA